MKRNSEAVVLVNSQVKPIVEPPIVDQHGDLIQMAPPVIGRNKQIGALLSDKPLHPFQCLDFGACDIQPEPKHELWKFL